MVTNEDAFDDDPEKIIDQIMQGAINAGKIENENLFRVLDRRQGIKKALSLAGEGDLVLVSGKGAEQLMVFAKGKTIPWDDRNVTREILQEFKSVQKNLKL